MAKQGWEASLHFQQAVGFVGMAGLSALVMVSLTGCEYPETGDPSAQGPTGGANQTSLEDQTGGSQNPTGGLQDQTGWAGQVGSYSDGMQPGSSYPSTAPTASGGAYPRTPAEMAYREGLLLLTQNRLPEASRAFTQAINSGLGNGQVYLRRSHCSFLLGNFVAALDDCEKAIRLKPDWGEAYRGRGSAHWMLDNEEQAIADYTSAIKYNELDSQAYFNRGWLCGRRGEWGNSMVDLRRAVELDPTNAVMQRHLAIAYQDQNDLDRALEHFRLALQLDPNDLESLGRRGVIYRQRKEYALALADLNACLEVRWDDPNTFYERALVRMGLGDYQDAINDLDDVLLLDRVFPDAVQTRAALVQAMHNRTPRTADLPGLNPLRPPTR